MSALALWLLAGAVAALVARQGTAALARSAPLRRTNYRGLEVPTAVGLALAVGIAVGVGAVSLGQLLLPDSARVRAAAGAGVTIAGAVLGFGLLGLWDDLTTGGDRGWRAHVRALIRGRATGGAVKLLGGGALSVVLVTPLSDGLSWGIANAGIVALSANAVNLFDLRPGRAVKVSVVALLPMIAIGGPSGPALSAALGATLAYAPWDLRERVMLGDAGANGLGAVIGVGIVTVGSGGYRVAALVALIVLHLVGERPGLSRVIASVRPLRAADRAGRAPE